jgi:hypothetical protein
VTLGLCAALIVSTVGVPVSSVTTAVSEHAGCHCHPALRAAGQCCCGTPAKAKRSCCAAKTAAPKGVVAKPASKCCKSVAAKSKPRHTEVRCPCSPGSTDTLHVNAEPRLAPVRVTAPAAPALAEVLRDLCEPCPGGAQEPATPPPRSMPA